MVLWLLVSRQNTSEAVSADIRITSWVLRVVNCGFVVVNVFIFVVVNAIVELIAPIAQLARATAL